MSPTSATTAARDWLSALSKALSRPDIDGALPLFADECFWRDLLAFSWNVITFEGKDQIRAMLESQLAATDPQNWTIEGQASSEDGVIEAWFTFDTSVSRGRGHLRLRDGKCWTLLTTMSELKGFEEKRGATRPKGVEHRARKNRRTWLDDRSEEQETLGHSVQPYCVVIGGGQGGIALGARLRQLGVSTIIVEKNARPGDSWRNRYRSLVLHDPVWYDHLPYLPFPDGWPVFTPKDKMGDWLEMYVRVMELNYWPSTECIAASYDGSNKEWTVRVRRDGDELVLKPRQLVFATGAYGFARMIDFPGADAFEGEVLHTSEYGDGAEYQGKRCVVIGSASSAHDVCVDLWENDADVTMIQRSPSIVVKSETLMDVAFSPLYSEEAVASGITTDKADLLFASVPFRLMPQFQRPLYEQMKEIDADLYDRLTAAGFLWDFGDDGSGLMMKALRTASGYYIDVGASELIANGDIKIKSGAEIERFDRDGLQMSDGAKVPADVVIHATGYGSMDEMIAHLISPEVARKVGKFWGYGSGIKGDPGPWDGELRNMWKPTAQQALWFHGGNLHLSRHYSLVVALQIKARMEGLPTPVYQNP